MINFTIPGPPRGKGRPRFSRRSGTAYTPAETQAYESAVKAAAYVAMNGAPPMTGPVSLGVVGYFAIPVSWSKKRREIANWHTSKPDSDNLLKAVLDGMNGVAFVDDAQVCRLHVAKVYDAIPRVEVNVVEVTE